MGARRLTCLDPFARRRADFSPFPTMPEHPSDTRRAFFAMVTKGLGALAAAIAVVPGLGCWRRRCGGRSSAAPESRCGWPSTTTSSRRSRFASSPLASGKTPGCASTTSPSAPAGWCAPPRARPSAPSPPSARISAAASTSTTRRSRFDCPCHASSFDLDGRCLSGPSPRGLDELEVSADGHELLVRYRRFRTGGAKKEPIGERGPVPLLLPPRPPGDERASPAQPARPHQPAWRTWLDERLGLGGLENAILGGQIPGGASLWHALGSVAAGLFVFEAVTGIFLSFFYAPSVQTAWASVAYVQDQLPLGWFVRGSAQLRLLGADHRRRPSPAPGPDLRRLPASARAQLDDRTRPLRPDRARCAVGLPLALGPEGLLGQAGRGDDHRQRAHRRRRCPADWSRAARRSGTSPSRTPSRRTRMPAAGRVHHAGGAARLSSSEARADAEVVARRGGDRGAQRACLAVPVGAQRRRRPLRAGHRGGGGGGSPRGGARIARRSDLQLSGAPRVVRAAAVSTPHVLRRAARDRGHHDHPRHRHRAPAGAALSRSRGDQSAVGPQANHGGGRRQPPRAGRAVGDRHRQGRARSALRQGARRRGGAGAPGPHAGAERDRRPRGAWRSSATIRSITPATSGTSAAPAATRSPAPAGTRDPTSRTTTRAPGSAPFSPTRRAPSSWGRPRSTRG